MDTTTNFAALPHDERICRFEIRRTDRPFGVFAAGVTRSVGPLGAPLYRVEVPTIPQDEAWTIREMEVTLPPVDPAAALAAERALGAWTLKDPRSVAAALHVLPQGDYLLVISPLVSEAEGIVWMGNEYVPATARLRRLHDSKWLRTAVVGPEQPGVLAGLVGLHYQGPELPAGVLFLHLPPGGHALDRVLVVPAAGEMVLDPYEHSFPDRARPAAARWAAEGASLAARDLAWPKVDP